MNAALTKTAKDLGQKYLDARAKKATPRKAILGIKDGLDNVYEEEGVDGLVQVLSVMADTCCAKAKDAEALGKVFFEVIAGGGDSLGEETATLYEKLTEKWPNSSVLVEMLADVYGAIVNGASDSSYTQKLDELFKSNPTLINAAQQRAYSLRYGFADRTLEEGLQAIAQLREIYEKFPQETFAKIYADGLHDLTEHQDDVAGLETTKVLEDLLKRWPIKYVAVTYSRTLSALTREQDKAGCAETIFKIEALRKAWPEAHNISTSLAYALANYSLCTEGTEKAAVLKRINELAPEWPPAEGMARTLADGTYPYATKPRKAK